MANWVSELRLNKRLWFLMAATVPALSSASSATSNSQEELARVIQTEKDFASASLRDGIKQSFLTYAAPDAVLFRPDPVAGVPALKGDPEDNEGLTLDWWPAMGVIANSGDLALSVGPWVMDLPNATKRQLFGYYATVWKKQPDGSWKFVIDGAGSRISSAPVRKKGGAITRLAESNERRTVGSGAALEEVQAMEAWLARWAIIDARKALALALARDAWVMGSTAEPAGTPNGWKSEVAQRPKTLRFDFINGEASSGADLAYTYGLVESLDPLSPMHATYLHVWQRRNGQWRLIFQGIKRSARQ